MNANAPDLDRLSHHSLLFLAWRRFSAHRMAFVSLLFVTLYSLLTFLSPFFPIYSYKVQVPQHSNLPPSFRSAGELLLAKLEQRQANYLRKNNLEEKTAAMVQQLSDLQAKIAAEQMVDGRGNKVFTHQRRYLLGSDNLGRDLLARTLYGGRVSILIGLLGSLISMLLGSLIGAVSAYVGGYLDYLIMRFVDVLYSLPFIIVVVLLMAFFGSSFINLFIALAIVSWLTAARMVRGQVLSLKNSLFVEAARSMGASHLRIILVHLLPNCLGVIIVFSTLRIPAFILFESFLSYLGLGISAPLASWGSLIRDGSKLLGIYSFQLWIPTLAMSVFLLAMNFIGDGLRDALDPRKRKSK